MLANLELLSKSKQVIYILRVSKDHTKTSVELKRKEPAAFEVVSWHRLCGHEPFGCNQSLVRTIFLLLLQLSEDPLALRKSNHLYFTIRLTMKIEFFLQETNLQQQLLHRWWLESHRKRVPASFLFRRLILGFSSVPLAVFGEGEIFSLKGPTISYWAWAIKSISRYVKDIYSSTKTII